MKLLLARALAVLGAISGASAQFPPEPTGITIIKSHIHPGVKISYKETDICETTPGVKSYSGYLHLPPGSLEDTGEAQPYAINTFFWFFEARQSPHTAPLSIWLNGGPGSSSLIGVFTENGPCVVNADSASTRLNPHSWNNEANMLYIDQPNQVGFSYDVPTNGTLDVSTSETTPADFAAGVPRTNTTFLVGTFPSQNPAATANTTENAAAALWHFAQTWFCEFPAYQPETNKISLWTESYGGRYGPAFAAFFQRQNRRIASGEIRGVELHLHTLGIVNGCVDLLTQAPSYPEFAYNNTYGIQAINETMYDGAIDALERPGGCRDQIMDCRRLAAALDPDDDGAVARVNAVCAAADSTCTTAVEGPYLASSNRSYYDVAHPAADPFPPSYFLGYLAQASVQAALGVRTNYTESVTSVYDAFRATGDYPRGGLLADLADLLDAGIRVALVYGDRDYACNWRGGEAVSLAIPYARAPAFRAAGYAPIAVPGLAQPAGWVRQHGNLSFSRVFQAGHEVPAYQPRAAWEIFMRALGGRDIATGTVDATKAGYASEGRREVGSVRNVPPLEPGSVCYVLSRGSCTDAQWAAVEDGSAVVRDWIVVGGVHNDTGSHNGSEMRIRKSPSM
ncbi:Alpha/Beta hydrolase protein [Geopyxis carbonaria]|nr:Alpha/Beta hydrolase protein [Geopyxis carbonaria]